jgi:hypothetical protein
MTREEVRALFTLAGIGVRSEYRIVNEYYGDHPDYADISRAHPWWLVKTDCGLIKIGWRKRVINIDWSDTPVRVEVTADDVTKTDTMVHAWTIADAVRYLTVLAANMTKDAQPETQETPNA